MFYAPEWFHTRSKFEDLQTARRWLAMGVRVTGGVMDILGPRAAAITSSQVTFTP